MPVSNEIPTVNFSTARDLLLIGHASNQPVLLLGDPGVGKSALAREVAREVGKDLIVLLGSTLDPTDVGGIPFLSADGKGVNRFPLAAVRTACEKGVILFLDEISCASPVVQAALLRLILERVAGDSALHPDTWVMAAANPPEQAPGGFELSAPLMGRVSVAKLRPSNQEVLDYMATLGEESSVLRAEAEDFALTAAHAPDLLQIDIPPDCVTGNSPWAAPRAIERAIRALAVAKEKCPTASQDAILAIVEGSIGKRPALSWFAIRALRGKLPTVAEIIESPDTALIPQDAKEQIAVLGLIGHVAQVNTWAAWIYAARLPRPEYRMACAKTLQKRTPSALTAAHAKAGVQARVKLIQSMPKLNVGN